MDNWEVISPRGLRPRDEAISVRTVQRPRGATFVATSFRRDILERIGVKPRDRVDVMVNADGTKAMVRPNTNGTKGYMVNKSDASSRPIVSFTAPKTIGNATFVSDYTIDERGRTVTFSLCPKNKTPQQVFENLSR